MTFQEWAEWQPAKDRPAMKERLAELVYINGGRMAVGGWGVITGGPGIYNRMGLEQEEALELIFLHGVVEGYVRSGMATEQQVIDLCKGIWRARGEEI